MREISDKYFRQSCNSFLLNKEEIEMLKVYALESNEPTGSMGDDTPISPIGSKIRSIYDNCRQKFAQVTNPPIDSLEKISYVFRNMSGSS